jgi:toxin ParE1/3/4
MNPRIFIHAEARQDLIEHFAFLGQDSLEVADRFLEAAGEAFERPADMPGIGSPREFENPRLAGVRQWRVHGFENYLIFYRSMDNGVEILRVIHGARDIKRILDG